MMTIFRSRPVFFLLLGIAFFQQLSWYPSYLPQVGTPTIIQNFIAPEAGCNWAGVAGQVFSLAGLPVDGRIVELHGQLEGNQVSLSTTSGSSLQMGPGGYDFQLSDHPVATNGTLYIQLMDDNGARLTRQTYFRTVDACDRNLTIVNLVEFEVAAEVYFPLISASQ